MDEKEIYYIEKFNCIVPNGYNIKDYVDGGETTFTLYDKEVFQNIVKDIQEDVISLQEISEKYDICRRTVYRINSGEVHKLENLTYPLRNKSNIAFHFCLDCGVKISCTALRCKECAAKASRKTDRPNREELKSLIRTKTFTELGKRFGVSDNSVRKWCKSYSLPSKVKEIKSYSDEEWELI